MAARRREAAQRLAAELAASVQWTLGHQDRDQVEFDDQGRAFKAALDARISLHGAPGLGAALSSLDTLRDAGTEALHVCLNERKGREGGDTDIDVFTHARAARAATSPYSALVFFAAQDLMAWDGQADLTRHTSDDLALRLADFGTWRSRVRDAYLGLVDRRDDLS